MLKWNSSRIIKRAGQSVGAGVVVSEGGGYEGPLDLVPGAGWMSASSTIRALSASMLGLNGYTLRRSSDNAIASYTYDGITGEIDQSEISAWKGAGQAFFSAVYDHSGNGIDIVQETAVSQPEWLETGLGNKPVIGSAGLATLQSVVEGNFPDGAVTVFFISKGPAEFSFGFNNGEISVTATPENYMSSYANVQYVSCTYAGTILRNEYHVVAMKFAKGVHVALIDGFSATGNPDDSAGTVSAIQEPLFMQTAPGRLIMEWMVANTAMSLEDMVTVSDALCAYWSVTQVVARPVITPDPAVAGDLLTVSNGTWGVGANPIYTYQWYADSVAIEGATNQTYQTIFPDQQLVNIQCRVTNTNDSGVGNAYSQSVELQ